MKTTSETEISIQKTYTLEEEKAAIAIQSVIRRFLAQKDHTKPELDAEKMGHYDTFVSGNEPSIKFGKKKTNGQFVFIGCSGMKSLEIIKEMIDFKTYSFSSDQFKNIPKLYIIDNSQEVVNFWKTLKKSVRNCATLSDFYDKVHLLNLDFSKNCRHFDTSHPMCHEVFFHLYGLTKNTGIAENVMFNFFKKIIDNSIIIANDWSHKKPFDFIQRHTDNILPIYIYDSNIIEYVGQDYGSEKQVKRILDNITSLNPALTIHSRTKNSSIHMRPTQFILCRSTSTETQKSVLEDTMYLPLYSKISLQSLLSSNRTTEPSKKLSLSQAKVTIETPKTSPKDNSGVKTQSKDKSFGGFKKGFLL